MTETNSRLAVRPAGKQRSKPAIKKEDLPAELARLQTLTLPELKTKWVEFYGKPLKGARRDFLIRGIAYRLQELIYGGLSAKTRRRLKQLAKQFARDPDHRPTVAPALKPGCRLLREWHGVMYEVVVLEQGFRHRDQTFRTLSEVARLITGTRWSGPVFFGLKKAAVAAGTKQPVSVRAAVHPVGQPTKSRNRQRQGVPKPVALPYREAIGDGS